MEILDLPRNTPIDDTSVIEMLRSGMKPPCIGDTYVKIKHSDYDGERIIGFIYNIDYIVTIDVSLCGGEDAVIAYKIDWEKLKPLLKYTEFVIYIHECCRYLQKCNLTIGELFFPAQKSLIERLLETTNVMSSKEFTNTIDCFILKRGLDSTYDHDCGLKIGLIKNGNGWPMTFGYIFNSKYIAIVRSSDWPIRIEVFSYSDGLLYDFNRYYFHGHKKNINNNSSCDFERYTKVRDKYRAYVQDDMTFRQFMSFGTKSARK